MATLYVPEDYPDLVTALIAASNGDTVVLDTSEALALNDYVSALDGITVRAAEGKFPVLDHTYALGSGLVLTGDDWTFEGLRFRSTSPTSVSAALTLAGTGYAITSCVFEGSKYAITGNWAGTVQSCQFRHITDTVAQTTGVCAFIACVFVRNDVTRVISGANITIDNATLIQCRATADIFSVATIRNCTAQACSANLASGYIFEATGNVTSCNAYDCTAFGLVNAGGSETGTTTVDPQHVNLATDFRLLPTSPLVGGGQGAFVTTDYNGNAFLSPISVGAYETLRLDTYGQFHDVNTLWIGAYGAQTAEEVAETYTWEFASATGVQVAALAVEVLILSGGGVWPGGAPVQITLWPSVSPGSAYVATARSGTYGYGQATVTASAGLDYPEVVPDYRNVAAVANSLGWQLYALAGISETVLVVPLEVGDTTAFVESTLGFADSGVLYVEGRKIAYASKTAAAFHGLVEELPRVTAIGAQTVVTFDEAAYVPPVG